MINQIFQGVESGISNIEKEVEENNENMEHAIGMIEEIEHAILEVDSEVAEFLEKNRDGAYEKKGEFEKDKENLLRRCEEIADQIEEGREKTDNSIRSLENLIEAGEDVSVAKGINEDRLSRLDQSEKRLNELMDSAGKEWHLTKFAASIRAETPKVNGGFSRSGGHDHGERGGSERVIYDNYAR